MARTIWKFHLPLKDQVTILMPMNAKILCAQWNDDAICLWAEVEKDFPNEERIVAIYGTGTLIPDEPGTYIGTVQQPRDNYGFALVWHVYEQ